MASVVPETAKRIFTPETLRSAAKQSDRCLVVPVRLRRAINRYLREQDEPHIRRKVLRLSESFSNIKDVNLQLAATTSKELFDDPFKSMERAQRWKVKSSYGDIGLEYRDDQTIAYVASRMPAVFSACHRVLIEVRRRLPGFAPEKVLDFGAGTGSAFWALREVWPRAIKKVNLVEPSKSMQRAGQRLIQGLKGLPLIHSYDGLQAFNKDVKTTERKHDLVIASYVLGEIPSLKDRITLVRQLWNLTDDVLVLVEPGTPHGSNIICQMRSHILWMEKRKSRKSKDEKKETSTDIVPYKSQNGAFVVAPCSHDGRCPLENSGTYCHFVQRLQRTSSQRVYKRSKGEPLRGFEDEKFSFVAFRRGQRPREAWPLDGMKFETLKEQQANRNSEDLETENDDLELQEDNIVEMQQDDIVPVKKMNPANYDSDANGTDLDDDDNYVVEEKEEENHGDADLGGGWGRIIFSPRQRGRQVQMDVCRSTKADGSEGSFERIVTTKSKNPTLHQQAKKSQWGDLWPFQKN